LIFPNLGTYHFKKQKLILMDPDPVIYVCFNR